MRAAPATGGGGALSTDPAAVVADCTGIGDAAARLACYDRVSGRQPPTGGEASAAARISDANRGVSDGAGAGANADNGATTGSPAGADGQGARPPPERRLQVIATGELATGRHWFRLDNGETWQQVTARRTTIGSGDQVRLTTSAIGTHHIRRADGGSRSSQVRLTQ